MRYLLERRAIGLLGAGLLILAGMCVPASGRAQTPPDLPTAALDANTFRPTADFASMLAVTRAEVLPHMAISSSLYLDMSLNPLTASATLPQTELPAEPVVNRRFDLEALVTLGVMGRADIGVQVPFVMHQGGQDTEFARDVLGFDDLGDGRLRDIGLYGKVWLVTQDRVVPAISAVLDLRIPTGDETSLAGEKSFTVDPYVVLSQDVGRLSWAGNFGFRFRGAQQLRDRNECNLNDANLDPEDCKRTIGSQFLYRGGFSWRVAASDPKVARTVSVELLGQTQLTSPFGGIGKSAEKGTDNLELMLGFRDRFETQKGPMSVAVGAGLGVVRGYGTPLLRGIISVDWVSQDPLVDTDLDGVPDASDRCVERPEDRDGYKDFDGCPDPDNDGDGIVDEDDECPNQDEDGVGSDDLATDGCPIPTEPDDDGDGIPNSEDKCPDQQEDVDAYEDWDGCPEKDNDGDGLADLGDLCPLAAEDRNGFEDDDGCPDGGQRARFVSFKDREIRLHRPLVFKKKTAEFAAGVDQVLDQLSAIMRQYEQIERVRVEAYPGIRGKAGRDIALERARKVVEELKSRGVTEDRLLAIAGSYDKKRAGTVTVELDKIRRTQTTAPTRQAPPSKGKKKKKRRRRR